MCVVQPIGYTSELCGEIARVLDLLSSFAMRTTRVLRTRPVHLQRTLSQSQLNLFSYPLLEPQ